MLFTIIVGVVLFFVGVFVGETNKINVNQAIDVLKAAEAKAMATLAQITAHKAS